MPTAQWGVYAYCTAVSHGTTQITPTAAATQRIQVHTSGGLNYCFAAGGGAFRDGLGPLNAIQINNFNYTMHVVSSAASNCVDHCTPAGYHMSALWRSNSTPLAFYSNNSAAGINRTFAFSTPARTAGIHFQFAYVSPNQATQVTKCEIWAGRDSGVTGLPPGGSILLVELCTTKASNRFSTPLTASRLALTNNGLSPLGRMAATLSTVTHNWHLGLCIHASAVGLSTAGRIRLENTFQ